ncbi:Endochitinase B [Rhodotorula toruloides]|nr:Endochitinase B [Rhodotorula toruloides]
MLKGAQIEPQKPVRPRRTNPILAVAVLALLLLFIGPTPFARLSHLDTSPWYLVYSPKTPTTMSNIPRPQGKVNVGYFPNWAIYARNYKPDSIPVEDLTHLLYCFADVKEDGEVRLTDAWSDEQIHYAGDSWDDGGAANLYGNLKALYLLKQRNRHLKVLLSIGGWTYSENGRFARPVSTTQGRSRFVETAVKLVEDYGLDGLDVDWEYPQNDVEAQDYVELLRMLRGGLDELQRKLGVQPPSGFELTIAAPCGPSNFEKLRVREMDQYLSFWNLMAYDYAGSWDSQANHQANLFHPDPNALSTDRAMRFFTDPNKGGVKPEKLVLGIPLYGRSFLNTQGPGTPFSGVGQGSWEAGSYDYKALPLPGAEEAFDQSLVTASCYNPSTREWISYDSVSSAQAKAIFTCVNGLGGAMYWELSGDRKPQEGGSIVRTVKEVLETQGGGLDRRENWLHYPTSKWENLRKGMQ